jgi:nitrous oxidase accessory protein
MNKHIRLLFVIAFLPVLCMSFQPASTETADIVVPDDFATIQAALDAASDGSRIYVRNGVYSENLVVNRSVTLIGEDVEETKIAGNWSQSYLRPITIVHDDVTVAGFGLVDSWAAVMLDNVSGCIIMGNKMVNNKYGVIGGGSLGNSIIGNVIESEKFGAYGIELTRASNYLIKGNQISAVSVGIAVRDSLLSPDKAVTSKNNTITENRIVNCGDRAVYFIFTKENLMANNVIADSTRGLALMWTDNNIVHHNNFLGNGQQVATGKEPEFSGGSQIRYSICQWESNGEGNYWSDYTGTDTDGDGIGDTPYYINEENSDNYPLMNQAAVPEFKALSGYTDVPPLTSTVSRAPTAESGSESFPISYAIIVLAIVASATVGLVVFLKKRHSST